MDLYTETKFLMKKYNITAKKSLGQNFLIDENVILDTIKEANINNTDLVIEIGPGLGTLTKYLLEKAGRVICIELDNRMISILNDRFSLYDNFEVINDDVLKIDLHELIRKNKERLKIQNVKIVANLPYYITTPIIMKLLEEKLEIESITVMVQKEVADRITALPGEKNAGAITYSVYYYSEAQKIRNVPNSSFIPEPDVESTVIKLNIRKKPVIETENEEKLFKLIKLAFMQRRKTLINAISNSGLLEKNKIKEILNQLGIDERVRGEELRIEDFKNILDRMNIK